MSSKEGIKDVIGALEDIGEDLTVPKNVRSKVQEIIKILNSDIELSLKINKALHELDEISNDMNLNSYARTQIWNIASSLEKL